MYSLEFAESLKTLMDGVLEAVLSVFEQAGVTLPARSYIAVGQPPHDCEQVTVSFQQLYLGPPGDEATAPQRCEAPRTAVLLVEIVRCTPQSGRTAGPSVESLSAYGGERAIDAYLLLEAGAKAADQWGLGTMADVSPGNDGGAMQAISMNLIVAVP